MNITVHVPGDLYRRASEVAEAENVAVEQLFSSAHCCPARSRIESIGWR